jgi:hypothetical protein
MIPVVDVDLSRSQGWHEAFAPHAAGVKVLLSAFNNECESKLGRIPWWGIRNAVGVGGTLYGNLHGDECAAFAAIGGVSEADVRTANLSYDLSHVGCSTLAVRGPDQDGPIHARNLDWELGDPTLLKRTLVIGRFRGAPAGPYLSLLWPGLYGGLTAMAPGRFSVSINFVIHQNDSTPAAIALRLGSGAMPVTWAVRHALDHCATYADALDYLTHVEIAAPVLYTLVGTQPDERVVIERGATTATVRRAAVEAGPVYVTNHYVSPEMSLCNGADDDLTPDSARRFAGVGAGIPGSTSPDHLFGVLSRPDVLRPDTQYQVIMCAKAGTFICRILGGEAQSVGGFA